MKQNKNLLMAATMQAQDVKRGCVTHCETKWVKVQEHHWGFNGSVEWQPGGMAKTDDGCHTLPANKQHYEAWQANGANVHHCLA